MIQSKHRERTNTKTSQRNLRNEEEKARDRMGLSIRTSWARLQPTLAAGTGHPNHQGIHQLPSREGELKSLGGVFTPAR